MAFKRSAVRSRLSPPNCEAQKKPWNFSVPRFFSALRAGILAVSGEELTPRRGGRPDSAGPGRRRGWRSGSGAAPGPGGCPASGGGRGSPRRWRWPRTWCPPRCPTRPCRGPPRRWPPGRCHSPGPAGPPGPWPGPPRGRRRRTAPAGAGGRRGRGPSPGWCRRPPRRGIPGRRPGCR